MALELDDSDWPLVRSIWPQLVTEADAAAFEDAFERWLEPRTEIGHLLDLSMVSRIPTGPAARIRGYVARRQRRSEAFVTQAVVVRSSAQLLRHRLFWRIAPAALAERSFRSRDDAIVWLSERLGPALYMPF